MTRRSFSWTLSSAILAPGLASVGLGREVRQEITFQATAGARLPHTVTLPVTHRQFRSIEPLRHHVWESRSYRLRESRAPEMETRFARIFAEAGIRPRFGKAAGSVLFYWIPFENLVARDRAWTALNADQRWIGVRSAIQSYQFGLYRLA